MKNTLIAISLLTASTAFLGGCALPAHDAGPYVPVDTVMNGMEHSHGIVLMDPQVQYSVTCSSIVQKKTDDGRLQVTAYLQNRETRRIQVQVNCVFKDLQGMPTEGEETPFRNLILTENAQEPLIFTALNTNAEGCTIRVRQAH
jgi:hypothetical protein